MSARERRAGAGHRGGGPSEVAEKIRRKKAERERMRERMPQPSTAAEERAVVHQLTMALCEYDLAIILNVIVNLLAAIGPGLLKELNEEGSRRMRARALPGTPTPEQVESVEQFRRVMERYGDATVVAASCAVAIHCATCTAEGCEIGTRPGDP